MSLHFDESQPSPLQRQYAAQRREARARMGYFIKPQPPTPVKPVSLPEAVAETPEPPKPKPEDLVPERFKRDWLLVQSKIMGMSKYQANETMKMVAESYGMTVGDLKSRSREAKVSMPRHIAMYLIREIGKNSYPEIARFFCRSDHTTPISAINKINRMKSNLYFGVRIRELEKITRIIFGVNTINEDEPEPV